MKIIQSIKFIIGTNGQVDSKFALLSLLMKLNVIFVREIVDARRYELKFGAP